MAKPWREVAASPQFKALPPDQQEAARRQYFDQVVAPQVDASVLDQVRAQFDAQTGPKAATSSAPKPNFSGVQTGFATTETDGITPGVRTPLSTAPAALAAPGRGAMRVRGAIGTQDLAAEDANRAKMFRELPLPLRAAIGAGSSVARAGRGAAQLVGLPVNEDQARRIDAAIDADDAGKVGAIGADVGMLAVPLSRVGALSKAGQYAASAGLGAGMGALQPVTGDESRAQNAGLGALLGLGGQGASDALIWSGQRAAQAVTPELRDLFKRAKEMGINLTPAQLSESEGLKRMVAMFDRMPFSGGASRARQQNEAGNRQLAKLIGVDDAQTLDAKTFDRALDAIGEKFDSAFEHGMRFDTDFLRGLVTLKNEAESQMDDTAVRTINSWIERIRKQGQGGHISGATLKSLDQSARKAATGGGDRQMVAEEFRNLLHDAFGKSAPASLRQTWDEARRQYATAMQLMPLVAKNVDGGIPLAQLQGAITVGNRAKRARARGRDGDLGTVASIGQRIKQPSSSGTVENALASQALNPLAWPVIGLSALVGRTGNAALNNGGLAALMMRQSRGQTRQALAPLARAFGVGGPLMLDSGADEER